MSINDKKISDLKTLGYTGGFNDMELTWLTALGYTTGSLQDRWIAYLEGEGYTGSLNDMLMAWLAAKGYSGSLTDRVIAALEADDFYVVTTLIFSAFSSTSSVLSLDASTASGSATATFARTSTAYTQDLDGIYREIDSGQERWQGGRYVKNLITYSEDIASGWTGSNATISGNTITTSASYGGAERTAIFQPADGDTLVWRFKIRVTSGTVTNTFRLITDSSPQTIKSFTPSTEWQTFSFSSTWGGAITGTSRFRVDIGTNTGGMVFEMTECQLEDATGNTNTNPSEYVATTTAAVGKWYDTTNGNTVASNVVTEATGDLLRPTNQPDDGSGDTRYAVYSQWQASTAYSVGDRIIPTDVSEFFCRGLNDVYLECVTAGTTGSTEIVGSNELLQSRDFDTTWSNISTTLTQNQTGIDGVANTAWSIEDNDGVGHEWISQAVTIPNDSNTNCASIYILKDTDETRFPEFQLYCDGGTAQYIALHINTKTGASAVRASAGTVSSSVEDHGDWWRVILTVTNNSTGNVTATTYIYPAIGTVIGTANVAAIGTCIFDQAQLELNTSVAGAPVVTTTTASSTATSWGDRTLNFTTGDGSAVWKMNGYYTLKGVLIEGAETNELLQSRQFDTSWTQTGTPTLAQDSIGIDGVASTAWTLGDDDGAAFEYITQGVTIVNDSNTHAYSIYVKKATTPSSYPYIQLSFVNGTVLNEGVIIDHENGTLTNRTGYADGSSTIEDHGDWWRVVCTLTNNSTGNTTANCVLMSAANTDASATLSAAATGTTIFDQAQLELNTSVASSPIPTTTGTVTRAAETLYFASASNIDQTIGTAILDTSHGARIFDVTLGGRRYMDVGTNNPVMYEQSSTTFRAYDGTNVANSSAVTANEADLRFGTRWSDAVSELQIAANGSAGTAATFDGSFDTTAIYLGSRTNGILQCNGVILNARIYSDDKGQSWLEGETAND